MPCLYILCFLCLFLLRRWSEFNKHLLNRDCLLSALKLQSRISEVVLNPDEINLIFEKCFLFSLGSVLLSFKWMFWNNETDSRQIRHYNPEFSLKIQFSAGWDEVSINVLKKRV